MTGIDPARLVRLVVTVALVGVLAVLISAGCGGDDGEDGPAAVGETQGEVLAETETEAAVEEASGPEAEAEAAFERLQELSGWNPVTEWPGPTSAPPVAEDKFVVMIPCSAQAAGCTRQIDGAQEAAVELGWRTQVIDGQGNPRIYDQAIRQAIQLGADGILIVAIADELAGPAIAAARNAGIPVISYGTENEPREDGVTWEEQIYWDQGGVAMGEWLIHHTEGDGKFAIVNGPEFPSVTKFITGARDTIAEKCSECEILAETDIAVADLGTTVGPRVVALLQANPEIEIVVAPYDPAANAMMSAVRQAGLGERVRFVASNADPPNLQIIREGGLQIASMGNAFEWGGWGVMDNFNRLFQGEDPVDQGVPWRLFTIDNAEQIPDEGYWDGDDFDYRGEYRRLWGLE